MARFRPLPGARIPLFDRLVDEAPWEPGEPRPLRVMDTPALKESIARDVARLFNTQKPIQRDTLHIPGTVLDYGIPDIISRPLFSSEAKQVLCADLVRAVRAFEPRLADVRVVPGEFDDKHRSLSVSVFGTLTVGEVGEPLSFPVVIHALRRE
jgi:type VI secretion system protein ImpF